MPTGLLKICKALGTEIDIQPKRSTGRLRCLILSRLQPWKSRLKPAQLNLLANLSAELSEEWIAYQHCVSREHSTPGLDLAEFWRGLSVRFPRVAGAAAPYIYFPVSSANCERSFSK